MLFHTMSKNHIQIGRKFERGIAKNWYVCQHLGWPSSYAHAVNVLLLLSGRL